MLKNSLNLQSYEQKRKIWSRPLLSVETFYCFFFSVKWWIFSFEFSNDDHFFFDAIADDRNFLPCTSSAHKFGIFLTFYHFSIFSWRNRSKKEKEKEKNQRGTRRWLNILISHLYIVHKNIKRKKILVWVLFPYKWNVSGMTLLSLESFFLSLSLQNLFEELMIVIFFFFLCTWESGLYPTKSIIYGRNS